MVEGHAYPRGTRAIPPSWVSEPPRRYHRDPMRKFVVDAGVVLHLAGAGVEIPKAYELLAPTLLRSQALSALHEAVQRDEIATDVAQERLRRIADYGAAPCAWAAAMTSCITMFATCA